jgi:hypothetical protein
MRKFAVLGLLAAFPLLADDTREQVHVSKTEHMDFPAGGLLRLNDIIGDLTIESWDQPGIEITTRKTTKAEYDARNKQKGAEDLDQVRITTERHEGELVLTFPRYGHFLIRPGSTRFELETHIFVPHDARLAIHGSGQLYIDNVAGAMDIELSNGTMVLHLPEHGHYDIDARTKWGNVNNDFAGEEERTRWLVGHRVEEQSEGAAQKLHLRVGYGDIVLVKIRRPQAPAALKPAS